MFHYGPAPTYGGSSARLLTRQETSVECHMRCSSLKVNLGARNRWNHFYDNVIQQPDDDRGPGMSDTITDRCEAKGLRMTEQRRIIASVLETSEDHPDVEELYARAATRDPRISIATVYRTVRLFEEAGILDRHDFGDGRARYEAAPEAHHDHLIDVETGKVVEFVDPELEALQKQIAEKLGYRLVDHRMELYAVRIDREEKG